MQRKSIKCPTCGSHHTRYRPSVAEVKAFINKGGTISGTSSSLLDGRTIDISIGDWLFGNTPSKTITVDEQMMREHFPRFLEHWEDGP